MGEQFVHRARQEELTDDDLRYWGRNLQVPNATKAEAFGGLFWDSFKYDTSAPAIFNRLQVMTGGFGSEFYSEKLSPAAANTEYNLEELGVPYGENDTPNRAEAKIRGDRAHDAMIAQLEAQEAGLGIIGQTSARMLGAMTDPLMIGTGIAGRLLIAKGLGMAASKFNIDWMNGIRNYIQFGGTGEQVTKSSVIAAELLENAIVTAAMDQPIWNTRQNIYGEDVTTQEKVLTFGMGTALGTGIGLIARNMSTAFPDVAVPRKTSMLAVENALAEFPTTRTVGDYAENLSLLLKRTSDYANDPDNMFRAKGLYEVNIPEGHVRAYVAFDSMKNITPDSSLRLGKNLGKAVYGTVSPALAEAKLIDFKQGAIVPMNIPSNRILDIDSVVPSKEVSNTIAAALSDVFNEAEIAEILNQPTLLKVLNKIQEVGTVKKVADEAAEVLDEVTGKIGKQLDVDAFRYADDAIKDAEGFGTEAIAVINTKDYAGEAVDVDLRAPLEDFGRKLEEKYASDLDFNMGEMAKKASGADFDSNIEARPKSHLYGDIKQPMKDMFEKDVADIADPHEEILAISEKIKQEAMELIEADPESPLAKEMKEVLDLETDKHLDTAVKMATVCIRKNR